MYARIACGLRGPGECEQASTDKATEKRGMSRNNVDCRSEGDMQPSKIYHHYLIPPRTPFLGNTAVFSGLSADLCHGNSISLRFRRSHRLRLALPLSLSMAGGMHPTGEIVPPPKSELAIQLAESLLCLNNYRHG